MLSVLPKLPPLLYLLFFSCLLLNCRSPPSWRPSSILPSHLWLSVRPSPLPFLFANFRLSSLRSGPVEPHTSNSSPVPLTCVAIRCFLDVIPYFSKNFNDWNHQPRGSLSDTTFFFFFVLPTTNPEHNGVATTTRAIEAACLLFKKLLGWI